MIRGTKKTRFFAFLPVIFARFEVSAVKQGPFSGVHEKTPRGEKKTTFFAFSENRENRDFFNFSEILNFVSLMIL